MYYRHFGLSGPPFQFTPSAEALYLGRTHRECIAALEWALLHERSGFMMLVGETGTGKTTLVSSLVARHFGNLHLAYVTNPRLSFEDIMRVVLQQLGVAPVTGGRLALIQAFENFLYNQPDGDRTALVIDEAQDLADQTFEDIRLLANSNGKVSKELQFILIGQPELLERLSARHMRQIRERIGAKATLHPLSPAESIEYVDFRLQSQRGKTRAIFESGALRLIVAASGGIPRRLNVLCHNALLSAYSEGKQKVTAGVAREVIKDYADIFQTAAPAPTASAAMLGRLNRWREASVAARRHFAPAAMVIASLVLLGAGAVLLWVENASGLSEIRKSAPTSGYTATRPEDSVSDATSRTGALTEVAIANPASIAAPDTDLIGTAHQAEIVRNQIRIQLGDTLEKIALQHLGSIDRLQELMHENPQIQDFNVLYPGQIVYLPPTRNAAQ